MFYSSIIVFLDPCKDNFILPLSGDVKPPSRLLGLTQSGWNFFFGDVEADVTHVVLVLFGVDAQVVDVKHAGALRQGQDQVLAAVHLQVVEPGLLVGNLKILMSF